MKKPVVTDSTCLIGLERIGQLDLLPALYDPVVIPPEVEQEFGTVLTWMQVVSPTNQALVTSLKLMVDDGEAEAIALASEKEWQLILDDRQARSVAKQLEIKVIGTIGILIKAKHTGIIPALKPLLETLEANNFYISHALKEEALRLVGEY